MISAGHVNPFPAPRSDVSAIQASHVYKIFGRRPESGVTRLNEGATRDDLRKQGLTAAVIDASFEVEPGEIFVVMGLSGSGKSTLIRMVNGLLPMTAGEMIIHGNDLGKLSKPALRKVRRENISMVFQHFALLPHRTVGENVAYGLKIQGLNRIDREAKADEALKMADLDGWGGYKPGELSGGMQQRVGLARALASETDILLMDEAFSALDPLIRRGMQDQLIELQRKLDKTILFITHDLNEAMRLGDRIAMMRDGRIEQIGTAEDILNDPASNYVARFVADVDRTRVLTAGSIAEPPYAVLGSDQGPQAAHKLLREHQPSWLLVVGRDRTPKGFVWEEDVARAVRTGQRELPFSDVHEMHTVQEDTAINELFELSAQHRAPLVVLDGHERVVGVIPRVTLLAAAGQAATSDVEDDPVLNDQADLEGIGA
ncbi:glycine betaine ABC transporter ATP-binding protein [Tessaracoccus flavus]|uniref:Glycine betaine ABC transporter ATP-binding protein n=1 Tax=Tessaracoccus flavus TaxID=1610493 RepID=A0A1Q2CH07_9ACTN|nr:glycine betaine ABC transporter ATP-binding protein [Tessaracoccus flavus]